MPFEELEIAKFTDIGKVRKIYKLTNTGQGNKKGGKRNTERTNDARMMESGQEMEMVERKELETMVLGLMALRGAT